MSTDIDWRARAEGLWSTIYDASSPIVAIETALREAASESARAHAEQIAALTLESDNAQRAAHAVGWNESQAFHEKAAKGQIAALEKERDYRKNSHALTTEIANTDAARALAAERERESARKECGKLAYRAGELHREWTVAAGENKRLTEALRELEWAWPGTSRCLACGALRAEGQHGATCWVAAALAAPRPPEEKCQRKGEETMPVDDYRVRIGHLAEALTRIRHAVALLGQRMPDDGDEGIAEKVQDFLKKADEEIASACWEL